MTLTKNIDTFLGCDAEYDEARIAIFGAPFDSTTSYRPGARFGSRTMRAESYQIETYSPMLERDLEDASIFDCGDLELCFGDSTLALNDIEHFADRLLGDQKLPFMLGGEHLVSLGAIHAALKKYPNLAVIQFDAHTDLREQYLGARLSHASVMRRAHDLLGDGSIFQFGIRSGERAEFQFAAKHTRLQKFNFDGLSDALEFLKDRPVYFTIDLDVLDPSAFPGTGTPEAGGVTYLELLRAALEVCGRANVIACDLVELAPNYDPSGISTATALKLMREMLLQLGIRN